MKKYLLLVTATLLTFSAALTAAETYAYVELDALFNKINDGSN